MSGNITSRRQRTDASAAGLAALKKRFKKWLTLPHGLGMALALAYLFRNSVFVFLVPASGPVMAVGVYLVLGYCFCYILFSDVQIVTIGMLFVMACLPGAIFSVLPDTTIPLACGWTLLMLVVGPLLLGSKARSLRLGAWTSLENLSVLIGTASCLWWLLRLPVLGTGVFTGVMTHANTVGPMSGLAMVIAASRALATQKKISRNWLLLTASCIVPTLASGSRTSVTGAAVGLIVVSIVEWRKLSEHLLLLFMLGGFMMIGGYAAIRQSSQFENLTGELGKKGQENTREQLWYDRIAEFKARPEIGVGIGYAEGEGAAIDDHGKLKVEPGSSYLAMLSMTGLSGTIALVILLVWVGTKWGSGYQLIPRKRLSELFGAGAFMAVNGIAEGWILAVGSPMCLIFWLWLTHLVDSVDAAEARRVREVHRRRVGRSSMSADRLPSGRQRRGMRMTETD